MIIQLGRPGNQNPGKPVAISGCQRRYFQEQLLSHACHSAQTSSQPAKGIPESAIKVRKCKGAMKGPGLCETRKQFVLLLTSEPWMTKSCLPLLSVHLCYLQRELHGRYLSLHFTFASGWWVHWTEAQGFPQAHDSALLRPKCSETQFLQGAREAKGGVRKASYVCGVFPCSWKVSKDISGADETFQHIHLESAVSLPSCIIYHTTPSRLKDCCKLFSESSSPLCAVPCNNLSKIYFGSGVLQQSVGVFFVFSSGSVADAESCFIIVKLLTRTGLQMLCPDSLALLYCHLWSRDAEAQNKCKAVPINLLLQNCSWLSELQARVFQSCLGMAGHIDFLKQGLW